MKKIIVTGANGVGKSHFAKELASVRPEIPVISFDVVKLLRNWQQRPRSEIDSALTCEIGKEAWILEGGPSLLFQAVRMADALVWLDPPEHFRAWQLVARPWKFIGKTRPELPPGNNDWPWQQYKFAVRSLKNGKKFRKHISTAFSSVDGIPKWHCRNQTDRAEVIANWTAASAWATH